MTSQLSKDASLDLSSLAAMLTPSLQRKFHHSLAVELGLIFSEDDPVWCEAREVLITGGVRAGKTTRNAFRTICKLLDPKVRLIWLVGPDYTQATEEFRYILEWGTRLGIVDLNSVSTPAEGGRILKTILGATVMTKSAQHPERLASVAPDMIVLCEPGQMSSEVYDTCMQRLAEKRGTLFMGGTLEDDIATPRWKWYEDLAVDWRDHVEGDRERSFSVPTWSNRVLYPQGIADPELQVIRTKTAEYTWNRKYGGIPEGVDNPLFPVMHEPGASAEFLTLPEDHLEFDAMGAIGVDYGTTFEHPSAVVVIAHDMYDRYWIREGWKGIKVDPTEIEDIVDAFKFNHGVYQICTDPLQDFMAGTLGGVSASKGAGTTEFRFSLVNGLLENRRLFFDLNGPLVREVWSSMRSLRRVAKTRGGRLVYERPLGDDLAQCVAYAIELIRGGGGVDMLMPGVDVGPVRMRFQPMHDNQDGRV